MTTEEKTETDQKQKTTPKKDSAQIEAWKKDYENVQEELKFQADDWMKQFLKADGERTTYKRKYEQAQAELEAWESKDNAEREPISQTKMQKRQQDDEKQARMQRFLKRIKN